MFSQTWKKNKILTKIQKFAQKYKVTTKKTNNTYTSPI